MKNHSFRRKKSLLTTSSLPARSQVTDGQGKPSTLEVVLTQRPESDVTVTVAADPAAGIVALPAQLVFKPMTWDKPQAVAVTVAPSALRSQQTRAVNLRAASLDGAFDQSVATVPVASVPVAAVGSVEAAWAPAPWGACSAECEQTRRVPCAITSTGAEVAAAMCRAAAPAAQQACTGGDCPVDSSSSGISVAVIAAAAAGGAVVLIGEHALLCCPSALWALLHAGINAGGV
jgi:hypothetical protein